jgi:Trk K+ transport system NAD-binding subunit
MLTGKRFILCGLSRLAVRIARSLTAHHADVAVLRTGRDDEHLLGAFGPEIRTLNAFGLDQADVLLAAGAADAACVLALADDDLDNLRTTVAAREAAPNVPVVLRVFDPVLADHLEAGLNVRRAYSVSALAAPAFVSAAFGDEVVETMRLGDGEVPLSRVSVRPGSPLAGLTLRDVKRQYGCAVVARRGPDGCWMPTRGGGGDAALREGEEIFIGGILAAVLRLSSANSSLPRAAKRRRWPRRRRAAGGRRKPSPLWNTRLPVVATMLAALLSIAIIVFTFTLKLSPVDALYFVVTTATTTGYGDITLKSAPDWLKLFDSFVMIASAAMLGVIFSYLAALATTERLDEAMGRRAGGMENHVVVAGLGNLGYRVANHFLDMGWETAVIELAPGARFVETLRTRCPVLSGDTRLPGNLDRASVTRASAFVACTNDDLANIQSCLHARRLNPSLITVARVFDDTLAQRLTRAFEIDHVLSATQCAAGAFIGAATDELAMRPIQIGDLELLAFRYTAPEALTPDAIADWHEQGIRLAAIRKADGAPAPPQPGLGLAPGDEAILCGPAEAVRRVFVG